MDRKILVSLPDFLNFYLENEANEDRVITKENFVKIIQGKNDYYKRYYIPKKSGGFREVNTPTLQLKIIQDVTKELLEFFYTEDEVPSHVFGFVKNRGIKENASLHTGKKYVLNLDLHDFFGSIKIENVIQRLSYKPFSIHRRSIISRVIGEIVTLNGCLPTGSPTSPIVSNFVLKEFDYSLVMFAKKYGLVYSRYADDITFSTNKQQDFPDIINRVKQRIKKFGFKLNDKKTRLQCSGSRQVVTGLVVNNKVSVKKEYISLTKCMLNNWRVYGIKEAQQRYEKNRPINGGRFIENVIRGRIDFIGHILNGNKERYHPTYLSLFKQYWTLNYKMDYSFIVNNIVKLKLEKLNFETELIASDKLSSENQEIRFKSYCFNIFRQLEILFKYFYFVKEGRDNGKVVLFFCEQKQSIMKRFHPNNGEIGSKLKVIIGRDPTKKITYDDLSNLEKDDIARAYALKSKDLSRLNASELEEQFLSEPYNKSSKNKELFNYLREIRNHYAHASDSVFQYERKKIMKDIKDYELGKKVILTKRSKIESSNHIYKSFLTWKKYKWLDEYNFDEVRDLLEIVVNDVREIERKYAPNNKGSNPAVTQ